MKKEFPLYESIPYDEAQLATALAVAAAHGLSRFVRDLFLSDCPDAKSAFDSERRGK